MLEELGIERISCCGVGEPFLVLQFLFPTGVNGWMGGWVKEGGLFTPLQNPLLKNFLFLRKIFCVQKKPSLEITTHLPISLLFFSLLIDSQANSGWGGHP
ncbi:MAG: hypothetical protein MUF49_01575 [Oculatellaceae cyanobacterium Prado106]|nr:hypothetical protein [Oculatellaceae cyanobacterium Prado106]